VHNIRRRRGRLSPWFDTECRSLRQECRRLERRYRRTYTAEHRRSWVDATRRRHQVYRSKREQYWLERVHSPAKGSRFNCGARINKNAFKSLKLYRVYREL